MNGSIPGKGTGIALYYSRRSTSYLVVISSMAKMEQSPCPQWVRHGSPARTPPGTESSQPAGPIPPVAPDHGSNPAPCAALAARGQIGRPKSPEEDGGTPAPRRHPLLAPFPAEVLAPSPPAGS